jgi:hypothetical protein
MHPRRQALALLIEGRRRRHFFGDDRFECGPLCAAFEQTRLVIEPLARLQGFSVAELGLFYAALKDPDRLVIDLERHRIGMAVLAAMRQ